jgi:hypothetical protein
MFRTEMNRKAVGTWVVRVVQRRDKGRLSETEQRTSFSSTAGVTGNVDLLHSVTEIYRLIRETCYLHHQVRCTWMTETIVSSETSVNFIRLHGVTSKKTEIFKSSP